jgi:hypothetical protein
MPTINKSLTTYLPAQSVEWLESYCLEYKHLQNKDGNPKLGTAVADIIARLADGELALPEKIEPQGTALTQYSTLLDIQGNAPAQYSTVLATLKGEVEDLKRLLSEYGVSKVPSTVLNSEAIKNEIEIALEPIKIVVSKLDADTKSQFEAVRDELKAISDRAVEIPVSLAEPLQPSISSIPTIPRQEKPQSDSLPEWVEAGQKRFYLLLVGDSELLAKVAESIELHPTDNKALAKSLVSVGLHKANGTALDSASISRIKKVVLNLNTP